MHRGRRRRRTCRRHRCSSQLPAQLGYHPVTLRRRRQRAHRCHRGLQRRHVRAGPRQRRHLRVQVRDHRVPSGRLRQHQHNIARCLQLSHPRLNISCAGSTRLARRRRRRHGRRWRRGRRHGGRRWRQRWCGRRALRRRQLWNRAIACSTACTRRRPRPSRSRCRAGRWRSTVHATSVRTAQQRHLQRRQPRTRGDHVGLRHRPKGVQVTASLGQLPSSRLGHTCAHQLHAALAGLALQLTRRRARDRPVRPSRRSPSMRRDSRLSRQPSSCCLCCRHSGERHHRGRGRRRRRRSVGHVPFLWRLGLGRHPAGRSRLDSAHVEVERSVGRRTVTGCAFQQPGCDGIASRADSGLRRRHPLRQRHFTCWRQHGNLRPYLRRASLQLRHMRLHDCWQLCREYTPPSEQLDRQPEAPGEVA